MNVTRIGRGLAVALAGLAISLGAASVTTAPASADIVTVNMYGTITVPGDVHYANSTYTVILSDAGNGHYGAQVTLVDSVNGSVEASYDAIGASTATDASRLSFQWAPKTVGDHNMVVRYYWPTTGYTFQIPTQVSVTAAPAQPGGTGSAGSIPVIGGLLSSLSAK
ncbi:hypothetical protein ACWELJ_06760 [Nocardia sp. NPDC004582]